MPGLCPYGYACHGHRRQPISPRWRPYHPRFIIGDELRFKVRCYETRQITEGFTMPPSPRACSAD